MPARDRAAVENVPNWKDWAIRLAAAYDLFGNGKTALKANVGEIRRVGGAGVRRDRSTRWPAQTETRTWADLDGNRIGPRCATGTCSAPRSSAARPTSVRCRARIVPIRTLKREYNWEYGVQIQHELFPRVSVTARLSPAHLRQHRHDRQPEPEPVRLDGVDR